MIEESQKRAGRRKAENSFYSLPLIVSLCVCLCQFYDGAKLKITKCRLSSLSCRPIILAMWILWPLWREERFLERDSLPQINNIDLQCTHTHPHTYGLVTHREQQSINSIGILPLFLWRDWEQFEPWLCNLFAMLGMDGMGLPRKSINGFKLEAIYHLSHSFISCQRQEGWKTRGLTRPSEKMIDWLIFGKFTVSQANHAPLLMNNQYMRPLSRLHSTEDIDWILIGLEWTTSKLHWRHSIRLTEREEKIRSFSCFAMDTQ